METLLTRPDGCNLFYTIDDFTDPWREPETVLFVHGLAESTVSMSSRDISAIDCASATLASLRKALDMRRKDIRRFPA